MTVAQLLVWAQVIPTLVNAGIATETQIAALIKSFHQSLTDAQLNAICALIIAGATKHEALAVADTLPSAPVA